MSFTAKSDHLKLHSRYYVLRRRMRTAGFGRIRKYVLPEARVRCAAHTGHSGQAYLGSSPYSLTKPFCSHRERAEPYRAWWTLAHK